MTNATGGRTDQLQQRLAYRRLATTRRAEEADELAFVYRQIHRRYGVYIAKRL